jgi:16S rRNA (cytidine1402-2'-O)-methyltransferase
MPGTLFVVATPIGNLEDITLRALRVMREVDLIAAEDTRRTAKLLAHYAIPTRTISFHEHNTRARVPQLLSRLESSSSIALVSDAGTPGISDPGVALVKACHERGIPVDPVPGASAPLAAAVASGFPLESLTILGFVPYRSKDRKKWILCVKNMSSTVVFFESPHRVLATLEEASIVLGDRQMCVARELTKVHQELIVGHGSNLVGRITDLRGEFTFVVAPPEQALVQPISGTDEQIYEEFCRMTATTTSRRAAITAAAIKYGRTTKHVYSAIERARRLSK